MENARAEGTILNPTYREKLRLGNLPKAQWSWDSLQAEQLRSLNYLVSGSALAEAQGISCLRQGGGNEVLGQEQEQIPVLIQPISLPSSRPKF